MWGALLKLSFLKLILHEWRTLWVYLLRKVLKQVLLGLSLGALCAIALRLIATNEVLSWVVDKWEELPWPEVVKSWRDYGSELALLLGTTFVALLLVAARKVVPLFRSWWAGITSFLFTLVFLTTVIFFRLDAQNWVTPVTVILVAVILEYWRQRLVQRPRSRFSEPSLLGLNIPWQRTLTEVSPEAWVASPGDHPIKEWEQDLIGRKAIVESLADHVLVLGTPVVALQGEFGDGKSSVLNLFRKAIQGKAIVVSFNAWLPGGEATFATDLFEDIAAECNRHVYIPRLRRHGLRYARTISGTVSSLSGLRELIPPETQNDQVEELKESLDRIPLPIVVLLDEMDRMGKEELVVVLKVLRGAASIPNTTFVCAFSEAELRRRLAEDENLPYDYLEKFFPISLKIGSLDSSTLGKLFQVKVVDGLKRMGFIWGQPKEETDLGDLWRESFSKFCTNFRKTGLLLNDVLSAARPIAGEVSAFDLIAIEALRRFFPDVHRLVRRNPQFLTEGGSWETRPWLSSESKKSGNKEFLGKIESEIQKTPHPEAARVILAYLFPLYEGPGEDRLSYHRWARSTSMESAEGTKRICHPDYFSVYFRSAVPTEMFSNAELQKLLSDLENSQSQTDVERVFEGLLGAVPKHHPKREDAFWKIGRLFDGIRDEVAGWLAISVANHAAEYKYDILNVGEAARALNLVFMAAQKLSKTPKAQKLLVEALTQATDDTFAFRIFEYTRDQQRNKILTDFSGINADEIKGALVERMRRRYGPDVPVETIEIEYADWPAFRLWADNSPEDQALEHSFWRRFIGRSRKRLAQTLNFIYPSGTVWTSDPSQFVEKLFPFEEARTLLRELTEDAQLGEVEAKALERFAELLEGKWPQAHTA